MMTDGNMKGTSHCSYVYHSKPWWYEYQWQILVDRNVWMSKTGQ